MDPALTHNVRCDGKYCARIRTSSLVHHGNIISKARPGLVISLLVFLVGGAQCPLEMMNNRCQNLRKAVVDQGLAYRTIVLPSRNSNLVFTTAKCVGKQEEEKKRPNKKKKEKKNEEETVRPVNSRSTTTTPVSSLQKGRQNLNKVGCANLDYGLSRLMARALLDGRCGRKRVKTRRKERRRTN